MSQGEAKFFIGQVIRHNRFDYRGVIFDVDPVFSESEEWYEQMAKSRPPKDAPWYHVLVDGAAHSTYVAERNLSVESIPGPINHPALSNFFSEFDGIKYMAVSRSN